MSRPSGSSDSELSIKFLFANYDGVYAVLRFAKTMLVADVKAQLMQNWPANVAPADNAKCIRLICMGRGMLQDAQTLDASKVPGFPTHPTPVNVSVLRAQPSSAAVVAKAPSSRETSARPTPVVQAAPGTAAAASSSAPDTTPGCSCIIL